MEIGQGIGMSNRRFGGGLIKTFHAQLLIRHASSEKRYLYDITEKKKRASRLSNDSCTVVNFVSFIHHIEELFVCQGEVVKNLPYM